MISWMYLPESAELRVELTVKKSLKCVKFVRGNMTVIRSRNNSQFMFPAQTVSVTVNFCPKKCIIASDL